MNSSKKAITFLFFILIAVALSSFLYTKYRVATALTEAQKSNLFVEKKVISINNNDYFFEETHGKYKIAINNERSVYDIIKNFKSCTISAGFPIDVSQEPQGYFRIISKSTLKEHFDINQEYDVGDYIVGAGFIADGSEIGYNKNFLIMKKDTNYMKTITYKVMPILYCFK